MICERPYRKGILELGCGRCGSCRVNRSRLWVGRMLLESYEHPFSCFVTLTYDKENLPCRSNLVKKDLQLFMKRLRFRLVNQKIRYYGVGEYGSQTMRPHYHLILFGVSPMQSQDIQQCWQKGFTLTGTAEQKSMSYVALYVTKKWIHKLDPRLKDKVPEFQCMSLRPGIGHGVVKRIVEACARYPHLDLMRVVNQVRCGGQKYSLGYYLRTKVDDALSITKEFRMQRLRTLVEEKFQQVAVAGPTYYQQRKSRVESQVARRRLLLEKGLL